jgi:hypothetical protein
MKPGDEDRSGKYVSPWPRGESPVFLLEPSQVKPEVFATARATLAGYHVVRGD